jgi:hypothetical protein
MPNALYDNLYRVTYSGELDGGEIFSHGWWISADGTGAADILSVRWGSAITSLLGMSASPYPVSTVRDLFPSNVHWTQCKVQETAFLIPTPIGDPGIAGIDETGGAGQTLPYQVSHAITVSNGRVIGKKRYNRWFMPPYATIVLGLDGRVLAGLETIYAAWLQNLATEHEAETPASSMCYYSHTGTPEKLALVDVRTDNVLDTHRSRRNALEGVRTINLLT